MNVLMLGMYYTELTHYSQNPEKSILWLLERDYTLLMENGELADYALGHKFIMNSDATIVIMKDGDTHVCPEGEYRHIFFSDAQVTSSFTRVDTGDSFTFNSVRVITKTGEPSEQYMSVTLLGGYGTSKRPFPCEPEEAIVSLLNSPLSILLMEPGELADFALGHKLLTNSQSTIVILQEDDYYLAPECKIFHIFFPANIAEQTIHMGSGYWKKTNKVRHITRSSYLTAYRQLPSNIFACPKCDSYVRLQCRVWGYTPTLVLPPGMSSLSVLPYPTLHGTHAPHVMDMLSYHLTIGAIP